MAPFFAPPCIANLAESSQLRASIYVYHIR